MEDMTPFDVVAFLFLVGMFILGYVQGTTRRIFGIIALVFSLFVAAALRDTLGTYLAGEWTNAPSQYSDMIAFGALFLAFAISLSIGIQLAYKSAPLLPRYPFLDELLGGVLGVIEGIVLLVVFLIVTDPYFLGSAGNAAAAGEFQPIRSLHDFVTNSLIADVVRHNLIANLFAVVGFLFPRDVVDAFSSAVRARLV